MKMLLSTNDIVLLSFTKDLLGQEGIEHIVLEENMSIMEGSIGVLPRRIMVSDDDYDYAANLLAEGEKSQPIAETELVDLSLLSDDKFLGGAIDVYQLIDGFRSGIDAVFLAAALPDEGEMRVLDAGCASGAVSLAIAARCTRAEIDGVEIEPLAADAARMNVARNGFDDRINIFTADLSAPIGKLEMLGLERDNYDFVVANPPFYDEVATLTSKNAIKQRANSGDGALLDRWMRFITAMLKPGHWFVMIHRADRLKDILQASEGRFGDLCIYPLFPKQGSEAARIIVRGRKGSRAPLKLMPGMVLHGETGAFTADAEAILRNPKMLKID